MQIIKKHEANYLRSSGFGEFIHHGHGSYNKYYMTEDAKCKKFLETYRKQIKTK